MGTLGEIIYDDEYAKRYAALAATPLGRAIYTNRWALIQRYVGSGTVLDYGSGPGSFNAHGPDSFTRFNYDINPACGFTTKVWLPSKVTYEGGKPTYHHDYPRINILTMWDSIEHVANFYGEIKDINPEWVFLSTPNIMACTGPVEFEKHLRLREHIHHFEPYGMEVIFDDMGYQLLESNYDEGKLRDPKRPNAIFTQVYKKR